MTALLLMVGTITIVVLAERHTAGLRKAVEVAMTQLEEEVPAEDSSARMLAGSPVTESAENPVAGDGANKVDGANETRDASSDEKPPTPEAWAAAWPRFRGPDGSGHSAYEGVPTTWDVEAEENVLWKTEVPLPGNGSPVVWKDRLFLTGADKERREVFCFDTSTGKMLWQKEVPSTPESTAKTPEVLEDTGFAAPSPTTDGHRVYAIFANGDVAALISRATLFGHAALVSRKIPMVTRVRRWFTMASF